MPAMSDKGVKVEDVKVVVALSDDVESSAQAPEESTFKRNMALFSLTALILITLVPMFLIGGAIGFVVEDIGGKESSGWLIMANSLALAAVAPLAGSISDLIGRRSVALLGGLLVMGGMVMLGTATRMDVAIGAMAVAGAGAGLAELVAISGISELAPVNQRGGFYAVSCLVFLPWGPSTTYAQLYSAASTWRWSAGFL